MKSDKEEDEPDVVDYNWENGMEEGESEEYLPGEGEGEEGESTEYEEEGEDEDMDEQMKDENEVEDEFAAFMAEDEEEDEGRTEREGGGNGIDVEGDVLADTDIDVEGHVARDQGEPDIEVEIEDEVEDEEEDEEEVGGARSKPRRRKRKCIKKLEVAYAHPCRRVFSTSAKLSDKEILLFGIFLTTQNHFLHLFLPRISLIGENDDYGNVKLINFRRKIRRSRVQRYLGLQPGYLNLDDGSPF
jgi:hypothetical protein